MGSAALALPSPPCGGWDPFFLLFRPPPFFHMIFSTVGDATSRSLGRGEARERRERERERVRFFLLLPLILPSSLGGKRARVNSILSFPRYNTRRRGREVGGDRREWEVIDRVDHEKGGKHTPALRGALHLARPAQTVSPLLPAPARTHTRTRTRAHAR